MKCPNCQKEQVRERKANLIQNVRRRRVGDKLDRYVCDNCEWSGNEQEVIVPNEDAASEYDDPIQW